MRENPYRTLPGVFPSSGTTAGFHSFAQDARGSSTAPPMYPLSTTHVNATVVTSPFHAPSDFVNYQSMSSSSRHQWPNLQAEANTAFPHNSAIPSADRTDDNSFATENSIRLQSIPETSHGEGIGAFELIDPALWANPSDHTIGSGPRVTEDQQWWLENAHQKGYY